MPNPQTLLEIAGAARSVARWSHAALLLIDPQLEYVSGRLPLAGVGPAIEHGQRLLALARAARTPVFHVLHHGRPGGALFDPQGPYACTIPELRSVAGETTVIKRLPNAFAGTGLLELIRVTRRDELIVAGFATHMCVSATARAALDHGFATTVVAAACATRDLPSPLGGCIPAATLHEAALAELADRFATVVRSPEVWETERSLESRA